MEKEIKIKLTDLLAIVSLLDQKKARLIGKSFQRTTRMDTPGMELEKKGVFLRVRSGFENTVTLKRKISDNKDVFERQEIETEVKDIDKLADIFDILGFSKRLILEKYRMEFDYKGLKIALDELPFGFYVELEGEPEKIAEVAKELNLDISKKIIVTYWDLFEDFKKETGTKGESIIFSKNYKSVLLK